MVQKMLFKDIFYLQLWQPFCSVEQNHLYNFGRGHYKKHLDQWNRRCCFKNFLSTALPALLFVKGHYEEAVVHYISNAFCSTEQNHLYNFSRAFLGNYIKFEPDSGSGGARYHLKKI